VTFATNVLNPIPGPVPATTSPVLYPVHLMTIGRQHFMTETDNTLFVNQSDLNAKFDTFGLRQTLAAGLEFAKENRFQRRARGVPPAGDGNNLCAPAFLACRTSLYFPVDTGFGGALAGWNTQLLTETTTYAAYLTDQIKLNDYFEVMGALRYDNFHTDFDDPGNALPSARHLERTDKLLSYRVGGVVHPTKNSSFYVAHGISYNPSSELGTLSSVATNAANVLLDPEKNTTYEIGAKVDVLNERLSLTGAMFKIEKENLRIPIDPLLNTALVLAGVAVSRGFEVSAAGRITDQWSITVGYSHLDTEIVKTTNRAEIGRELPNAPSDSFSLWTTYDVTPQWTVGGGALYQSDTFVNTTNTAYVPEFWRFDLMTSYKITPKMLVQLNIYNLTDELYYAQYYSGHAVPAAGRYASLSLRTRW
jgi:catecholate siderophore receptor